MERAGREARPPPCGRCWSSGPGGAEPLARLPRLTWRTAPSGAAGRAARSRVGGPTRGGDGGARRGRGRRPTALTGHGRRTIAPASAVVTAPRAVYDGTIGCSG